MSSFNKYNVEASPKFLDFVYSLSTYTNPDILDLTSTNPTSISTYMDTILQGKTQAEKFQFIRDIVTYQTKFNVIMAYLLRYNADYITRIFSDEEIKSINLDSLNSSNSTNATSVPVTNSASEKQEAIEPADDDANDESSYMSDDEVAQQPIATSKFITSINDITSLTKSVRIIEPIVTAPIPIEPIVTDETADKTTVAKTVRKPKKAKTVLDAIPKVQDQVATTEPVVTKPVKRANKKKAATLIEANATDVIAVVATPIITNPIPEATTSSQPIPTDETVEKTKSRSRSKSVTEPKVKKPRKSSKKASAIPAHQVDGNFSEDDQ
ncbi:Hypothetical protein MVR_LOCUS291 [uncultured virus]|nr:Hypothetical protein MVR_LOCUS291 [uncultured virus]